MSNPFDQFDVPNTPLPSPVDVPTPVEAAKLGIDQRQLEIAESKEARDVAKFTQEQQADAAKQAEVATGVQDSIAQMRRVIGAAQEAKKLSQEGWFATGFGADTAKGIGGTTAKDVAALLNTIGSNTAFDRLQRMRAESPTGGALGAVSEIELQLLRDSIASLDQSQSDEQFQANMDKIIDAYQRVLTRLEGTETPAERKEDDSAALTAEATNQDGPGGGTDAGPPRLTGGPFVNQEGRIAGNRANENAMGLAAGGTRQEDDPDLVAKGVRQEYLRRLERGDSAEQIIEWADAVGIHPSAQRSIIEQIKYRRANPHVPIDQYDTSELDDRLVTMGGAEEALNRLAQSPAGTFAISAGDAASGFTLDNIIGATGGNAERARLGMDAVAAQNPVSSGLGTATGGVLAALGLEGTAALRAGTRAAPYIGDAIYGAAAGAGGTDYTADGGQASVIDRVFGAGQGIGAGLVGSFLGQRAGNLVNRSATGVTDPNVRILQDEGVPLTVGRQVSPSTGRLRRTEERIAGLPLVGDAIKARQREGIEGFDKAAFNRALKPIGETIGDKVGEEAYAAADDMVSAAYRKALDGKSVTVDQQLVGDLTGATTRIFNLRGVGEKVANDLALVLEPYMQGTRITGDAMQDISRELRALKSSYRDEVGYKRISGAIDDFEDAIFGVFRRQAPEVMPDYEKARTAARRLFILQDAVLRAKNTEGVFTPAQLGMAERQSMSRFEGKRAAARGEGPFHDLQRAGQEVLPDKIPDSGTAGRWILPALLVGGGTGAGAAADASGGEGLTGTQTGLALGTVLSLAYSRAGQRVLTKPGRGVDSPTLRRLLESPATGRAVRAATASGGVIATTP